MANKLTKRATICK